MKLTDLSQNPNPLAKHYSRFQVDRRLLLTGHSHQAWPDAGFEGQQQAWFDAAQFVDDKWDHAFATADRVRSGFAKIIGDDRGYYALASSTHELIVRFLSALPLGSRRRLVTTDGEYHTLRRQLSRLEEEGIEVIRVSSATPDLIAEQIVKEVTDQTAAVFVSSVLFQTGYMVPGLGRVLQACQRVGAELLVDAYHSLNVAPFSLERERLNDSYVVGGGYKYCQLGEGNCFLRIPPDSKLRPVITGWYCEFSALTNVGAKEVAYGKGPDRFAGSTYDPTSHYRAASVFDFFQEHRLIPTFLREVSQHQIGLLAHSFDDLDLSPHLISRDRSVEIDRIGGFLALCSPKAEELYRRLKEKGVSTDYRGDRLRFGPAPYHSDLQLRDAMEILGKICRKESGMFQ